MLSQDVTANERAQNVFEKWPIVPHNFWFANRINRIGQHLGIHRYQPD